MRRSQRRCFHCLEFWRNERVWYHNAQILTVYDPERGTPLVPTTTSIYLRHEFTLDNLSGIQEAVFAIDYDDGFVAYLNGTEIARGNAGEPGEVLAWNAILDGWHEAVFPSLLSRFGEDARRRVAPRIFLNREGWDVNVDE